MPLHSRQNGVCLVRVRDRWSPRGMAGVAALGVLLAAIPAASATGVSLEYSGEAFSSPGVQTELLRDLTVTSGETSYLLHALGSGVRRQFMFKVYVAAVYAEDGADLSRPYRALVEGDFVKHMTLRFVRDTAGNKVIDAYEKGFRRVLEDPTPELTRDKEALLGYFESGIRSGETIELTWVPGEGLHVSFQGEPRPTIPSEDLARAIMRIYFGDDPVSTDLKRDMVRFVERP